MRKIEKVIALIIIGLAIFFGAAYIFLNLMGKAIISRQLEGLTHKKTTIGYFGFTPGLHLEIRNLNIEDLLKVDAVSISPNLFGLLTGKIIFNSFKLDHPEFTFNKTPPPENINQLVVEAAPPVPSKPEVNVSIPLAFKSIKIKNGKINFIDQSITPNGVKIVIKDINSSVRNLYFYPRPVVTNFEFKGTIPWREGETQGKIDLEGWVNHFKKDMRATLKIKDIDGVYLYPYYSTWVDLGKARIEKAKLNFSSEISGLNNNVTIESRIELTDMVRKPLEPGESEEKASKITNKVLDMFKTIDQGKVEVNFTIKTKMDSPHFGFNNFKTAFEDKINQGRNARAIKPENVLSFPVKVVESGVRSFTDLGRAVVDGVFAIGGEIASAGKGSTEKKE